MQTPHHFFSPDPFERNLGRFRKTPNEGTLFYGLVQDGNDMWDATFFCGSCAVIRRKPLDEIGGIAVEVVTEDAHTSLRLHRRGYTSAYMRIPQAAGLATESLSAHIGQRIRWARGMMQIFRLDNPLTGKGLKFAQRLCYVNAMFHFLSGIATADLPDCAAGVPAASCLHHLCASVDDRPIRAAAYDPCQPDQLQESRANIATLSGVKSTKRCWRGISHHRRWWR